MIDKNEHDYSVLALLKQVNTQLGVGHHNDELQKIYDDMCNCDKSVIYQTMCSVTYCKKCIKPIMKRNKRKNPTTQSDNQS